MTDIFAKIITRQNANFNLHMWHVGLLKNRLNTNFTIDQILKFVFIQSIVNGGNKFTVLEEQFINRTEGLWGVYRFKEGFGGTVVRHIGAWDLPVRRVGYGLYTRMLPKVLSMMRHRGRARTEVGI